MGGHARLYQTIRTAHLERAHQLAPAAIIYRNTRYDFEAAQAEGLELVDGTGLRAATWLFTNPPSVLEINEPLMLESSLWTYSALLALGLRHALGGPRTLVVTYAIENRSPTDGPPPPKLRSRVKLRLRQLAAKRIWKRVDRIAYGTEAASELYRSLLGPNGAESRLVWALPEAAVEPSPTPKSPKAVFVSAFSERKGIPALLAAWPTVAAALPQARLVLIGKGGLQEQVEAAAALDPSILVLLDPPRSRIRAELAAGSVLVLPSQPTPTWREQVGLPIVEGLGYGCTVVTTAETGLAQWLVEQGHQVIAAPAEPDRLAASLISALSSPLPPAEVQASLPLRDGRLAADDWLFS